MTTLVRQGVKAALVRGEDRRMSVTIGAGALEAGDIFQFVSGLAVACSDGSPIDGVICRDGAISATNIPAWILGDGDVWDFTVASLTADVGDKLVPAGADALDDGSSTNPSIGIIIEGAITTAEVQARVLIQRSLIA